jgi:HD-GYP domain-containing protein (c-di-GMP phosphodiesterase class II)
MSSFDNVPVRLRNLPIDLALGCPVYSKLTPAPDVSGGEEYAMLVENPTLSQTVIDRLKRAVFPASQVYIPRQCVLEQLFDKGHFVGFNPQEVQEIRNGDNPWDKKKIGTPIADLSALPKTVTPPPVTKIEPNTESNAEFFKEKFKIKRFGEVINIYNKTRDITDDMLKNAARTGRIDTYKGGVIAKDVQEQVNNTDVSLIVQAINQIRTADQYLHTHCLNVAFLNGLMGRWMMFDSVRQNELVETGLFHDIGKLALPADILNKPEPLPPDEMEEVKKHPILSMEMLMKSGVRNKAMLEGVVQHHERLNGTGYPNGLVSNKISEYARITAISDTYDAMVTKRFHQDSQSPFVILEEFGRGGYSELDIRYVNVFINCMVDELQGKEIIMNDGSEAVVLLVDLRKLLYPIVEIDGRVVSTDENLYCVRMKNVLLDGK